MRKLKFLILTDHLGHSKQNSLYSLTRKLVKDSRTAFVFIASRGDDRNNAFFTGKMKAAIYGLTAKENFSFDPSGKQFSSSADHLQYGEADVVWLRLPPPADQNFFAHLTPLFPASAPENFSLSEDEERPLVINHPAGIIETGSKAYLLNFSNFTAAVRRVQSKLEVQRFATLHPIVLKPLQEYGGRGLVRIMNDQAEVGGEQFPLHKWLDTTSADIEAGNYLAMKYLKNVSEGDKRILVVNGEIMGASLRIPAPGQWLCNVSQGGTSVPTEIAPEEEEMING